MVEFHSKANDHFGRGAEGRFDSEVNGPALHEKRATRFGRARRPRATAKTYAITSTSAGLEYSSPRSTNKRTTFG